MKSLSVEVLKEINKTLALLTAQIDKLSDLFDKIDSIEGPEKLALYDDGNESESSDDSEDSDSDDDDPDGESGLEDVDFAPLEEDQPAPDSPEREPELEPVDLSQDIEVEPDGIKLSEVHDFQWMIDIPGSKVSNVISAISLNDRVLLINTLFKENPELFQQTINEFNKMDSISDAISYVFVTFPEWNLNSDVVYRLMMAVRRKLA